MSTALDICNTALLLCNASQINSFDDSTREAVMCNSIYNTTRDSQLSKHPWSFSLFQEELAKTLTTPEFEYTYEYQLPTGYIRILKMNQSVNDYRILKDKLFTDQDGVKILYQKNPGEEFYPAYFRRMLEFKLAEILNMSLVQDDRLANQFQEMYLLAMREARGVDSQNTPNITIRDQELALTAIRGADQ